MFDNVCSVNFDSLFSDVIFNITQEDFGVCLCLKTVLESKQQSKLQFQVILIGPGRKLLEQDLRAVR